MLMLWVRFGNGPVRLMVPVTPKVIVACRTERWAVKTGGDVDAGLVDLSNPVVSSVSEMNTFQRPGTIPRANRADWVETTVFQVYATLTVYKRETDEDYHIVLQDDDGST
jgi:hypothetical protein